ncbi:MAG: hypothetical protein H6832_00730 [Planctomycetes bacterium]|nr:hypothetical protein [Planctomycetota bacterium]MCB9916908.1 hypothetical protein [Planctomycetota bacterium]
MITTERSWISDEVRGVDRPVVERLLAGEIPPGCEIVVERVLRRVLRLQLESGTTLYAKQHGFPFVRVRLRYAARRSPTERERAMLDLAAKRGLRVPRPLAEATVRGPLGPTQAVLVTLGILEGRPATPDEALDAIDRLVEARFFHPDLHPDNLRICCGEPVFFDFQSVRTRAALHPQDRMRMFAKFAAGLGRTEDGRIVLPDDRFATAADRVAIQAAVARLDAAGSSARRRHRRRTSTKVVRERVGACGLRLRLRDIEPCEFASARFGPPSLVVDDRFGETVVAVRDDGSIRRLEQGHSARRGQYRTLLEAWAMADEKSGFLAWERTAPWPWGTQALYIRDFEQRD